MQGRKVSQIADSTWHCRFLSREAEEKSPVLGKNARSVPDERTGRIAASINILPFSAEMLCQVGR